MTYIAPEQCRTFHGCAMHVKSIHQYQGIYGLEESKEKPAVRWMENRKNGLRQTWKEGKTSACVRCKYCAGRLTQVTDTERARVQKQFINHIHTDGKYEQCDALKQ